MISPSLLAFVTIGIALLIAGLSLPLILRKVPMNPFYGVRFRQSFQSQEAWYAINGYGGKALLIASIPILLVGLYGLFFTPKHYLWITEGVLLLSITTACILSYLKARKV